jgi:ribonuclease P protein component
LGLAKFPKSARLLKKSDFRFRPYKKFFSDRFSFYFKKDGAGRLGISISKKVLKKATDRNRLKRLLRESYREIRTTIPKVDIHVVAREGDLERWKNVKKKDIQQEWESWASELNKSG